jgi:general secretion pathway protein D
MVASLSVWGCTMAEVRTGDRFAAQGQWDQAVDAYRQAAKKEPFDDKIQKLLNEAKARAAEQHYVAGRKFLEENRIGDALYEFKLALGLDPSRAEHHAAMGDALRLKRAQEELQAADRLSSLGRLDEALDAYERAVELDPSLTKALDGITKLSVEQRAAKSLGASTQPITLRFQNAKLREVFEILARAGGINVLFDKDVRDDPITIFIKDTPFDDALNLILTLNGLMAKRAGPETVLIMPNTKPKHDQYQDLMIRTFYLSNAKAKDMVNLVRTMLDTKKVYVNEPLNALVVRDTPAKLMLAERIILANDRREAEVELDLEVLEVNRTKTLEYGLSYAKSAGFGVVPPGFTGGATSSALTFTYAQLTDLGPENYIFTLPSSVILDFFKQESDAKTLASPKLRVINGKQASINVGDKQPILLSTTNVLPGQAATGAVPTTSTVTSIEFKDTGIKLSVEPTIHLVDEITLKLKIEVTRLGDQVTLQSDPLIQQFRFGTRTAETVLNMKNDETVILGGLIQDEDRKSFQSVPWLDDIPFIGKLFRSTKTDTITTEVVLTITPRILRNVTTPAVEAQAIWSGTETAYDTGPLFAPRVTSVSTGALRKPLPEEGPPAGPLSAIGKPSAAAGAPVPPGPAVAAPSASVAPVPGGAPPPPVPAAKTEAGQQSASLGPVTLAIRPVEVSALVGQEFRVDLTTEQLAALAESVVGLTFDPQALEFRRAEPGAAAVSATPGPGRVSLSLKPQGTPPAGGGVVASLIFQAKNRGEFPVMIQQASVTSGAGRTMSITTARTLVRIK